MSGPRRVVTTVVCPNGHAMVTVTAGTDGFTATAPHISGITRDAANESSKRDRRHAGGATVTLRPPQPNSIGEVLTIACGTCKTDHGLDLHELYRWASAGRRRVVCPSV